MNCFDLKVRSELKKTRSVQKLAIGKKSTDFVQSWWNLVKMISSWGNHFHHVSWALDKNCRFFTKDQVLNVNVNVFALSKSTWNYLLKDSIGDG